MATAAQFRIDFAEFASTTTYPDSAVNFWINLGTLLLNACQWADILDTGIELFAAHNLALEQLAANAGASGGVPGLAGGIAASKTVDKLSITYDTKIGIGPEDAGQFNMTTYGRRFWWLMNMAGMGPTQMGAGAAGFPVGQVGVYGGYFGAGWPFYGQ